MDCLREKDSNNWVLLLRAHPAVSGLSMNSELKAIDVTKYEDMADLLLIADMLITDYSSSAGDYALTGKPIILFQSDYDEFIKTDRTFYFDIDKSPYLVAKTQNELIEIINNITEDKARANCRAILDFYGTYETGNASINVSRLIVDWFN